VSASRPEAAMHVLVTGASGAIGRSLSAHLASAGHRVRAFDLVEGPVLPGVDWVLGDVTDPTALSSYAAGCDAVIHLAAFGLPWLASEEETFRINDYGSFCVFRAAAEANVRRVICASSINALGMYFGRQRMVFDRIPITEEHRRVTSDIYSFSKQILEDIAAYFHRSAGISSICLRMGGNMRLEPQPAAPEVRDAVVELLAQPRAQAQARVRAIVDGFFGRSRDLRERYHGPYIENAIATGSTHLWTALDIRDRDEAFLRAMTAEFDGAHVVNVADSHNTLGLDARELANLFYPEAEVDAGLFGTNGLWSIERARTLLGFEPQYSVKQYWGG
jgi:nucleoside-diphosphate-sugar epimerase